MASVQQFTEASARVFRAMPFHEVLPKSVLAQLSASVRIASMDCSALEYASFSVFVSIIFLLLSLLFFSQMRLEMALLAALLASACFFFLLLGYPSYLAQQRTLELERDIATGLKTIAMCLSGGNSFESSLQAASAGHGEFSKEISKTLSEIRSGKPVPPALRGLAEFESLLLKRAASQLVFEYEHGGKGDGLSAIADEALALQQAKAKEHSGRLGFLTVVFVAVSAVVPALFSAYLIIAGSFLEIPFSQGQVLLAFAVAFPLADALLLAYMRASAPKLSVGR